MLRICLAGALPGALVYALMFVLSVTLHASADYMGVEDSSVSDRVMAIFKDAITAQQLAILALYLGIGAALGLFATVALRLRDAMYFRARRGVWNHALTVGAFVLIEHTLLLVASMAAYPAVYAFGGAQFAPMGWLLTFAVDVVPLSLAQFLPWLLPLTTVLFAVGLLRRHPPTWLAHRRAMPIALAAGLAIGVATMLAVRAPRLRSARRAQHPDVIILAVDSLRADLLRTHPEAVPNIAALARRATLFTRAVPTVPRTYPSWASILTGRYPHEHGIRHMFPVPPTHANGLVIEHGLPEALRAAGYRTGVVSDFAGDVFKRGDWGFETVDTPDFTLASNVATGGVKLHLHLMPWLLDVLPKIGVDPFRNELLALERLADPEMVEDAAMDFVASDPDAPYFLVAFFSAGHFPFAAPSPWWRRFTDPDYRGQSRFLKQSFGTTLEGPEGDAEKAHLFGLYRSAIAASDAAIGRMLKALEDARALDDTIIIVTADHGENIYEHGLGIGHGDHLYGRTTLEVPLVIDYPGNPDRARVFEMPVTLADIGATIAAHTGVSIGLHKDLAGAGSEGIDLTRAIAAPDLLSQRPIFAEIDLWFFPPETRRLDGKRIVGVEGFAGFTFDPKTWAIFLDRPYQPMSLLAKHRMVLANQRKLLYIPTRDGVRWELYDPTSDPGDDHDLALSEPEKVKALQSILWRWMLLDPAMRKVGEFLVPEATP